MGKGKLAKFADMETYGNLRERVPVPLFGSGPRTF